MLTEYRHYAAFFVFFLHYVSWQEITGQHKMKTEMSSVLFTCKSYFTHDLNMTVLNVLEIAFVDIVSHAGPHFPISL